MPGLLVFTRLKDALDAGFAVYDKTCDGYLVRKRTDAGFAMAVVELRPHADLSARPDLSELDKKLDIRPAQEWR